MPSSSNGPSSADRRVHGAPVTRQGVSGPWVGAFGNLAPAPYRAPDPPPAAPMPSASNWKVVQAEEIKNFLLLRLNYPDCKNYEGNKILVFRDIKLIDLVNRRLIDPHFFPSGKYKSPIARFEPTDEGWAMAKLFASAMCVADAMKGKR